MASWISTVCWTRFALTRMLLIDDGHEVHESIPGDAESHDPRWKTEGNQSNPGNAKADIPTVLFLIGWKKSGRLVSNGDSTGDANLLQPHW